VESRTVTLDAGDTLAGMLEDVGISARTPMPWSRPWVEFFPRALKTARLSIHLLVATSNATGAPASAMPDHTVMVTTSRWWCPGPGVEDGKDATAENSQAISRRLSCISRTIEQK